MQTQIGASFSFRLQKKSLRKENVLVLMCRTWPLKEMGYLKVKVPRHVEVRIGLLPPTPHECAQGYWRKAYKNEFQNQEK